MKIGQWTTCIGLTVLVGCHPGLNSSIDPGEQPLPAFAVSTSSEAPSDTPSLTAGHDRSHWRGHTVTVAPGSVAHPPIYASWAMSTDPPTSEAAYPTAQTALDHAEPTPYPVADMTLRILAGYGEFVGIPVELFVTPPPTVEHSPTGSFERLPDGTPTGPLKRWFAEEPAPPAAVAPTPETPEWDASSGS